jgi:uncharacterized Ntn-hydrolase superfamily protein
MKSIQKYLQESEMKIFRILFVISIILAVSFSIAQTMNGQRFTHTFSIVAVDEETGQIGAAVQSHWFSVGSVVTWAEAGVGAVATQSLVNVSFGPRGLSLLKGGKNVQEALDNLINSDEGREFRQLAIIDSKGDVSAYTGNKCIADAGHFTGKNYSVQANMMLNDKVVSAMAEAYENSKGPLAERMMAALKAAQDAGGDIRGEQSAALLVVRGKSTGKIWEDRLIDIRVEDHPHAVEEIDRILKVYRAYEHMNKGDIAIEKGDVKTALEEYGAAKQIFPENNEIHYWTAVSLANIGKLDQALPFFKEVFTRDKNWIELTRRIVPNGLLKIDQASLQKVLNVIK